jgi:hypothetical protein
VDHIIVLGDAHLRRILRSYAHYYKKSERIGRLIQMHRYLARFSGPEANSDTHCFAHSITSPSSFVTAEIAARKLRLASKKSRKLLSFTPIRESSGESRKDSGCPHLVLHCHPAAGGRTWRRSLSMWRFAATALRTRSRLSRAMENAPDVVAGTYMGEAGAI